MVLGPALSTRSSVTESTVCSTWFATCAMAIGSLRRIGPSAVVRRFSTTATRSWTSLCSVGRRNGRTHRRAGRSSGTQPGPWAGLRSGRPCGSGQAVVQPRNGHGSKPGTRTIWDRRTGVQRPLRITATDCCRRNCPLTARCAPAQSGSRLSPLRNGQRRAASARSSSSNRSAHLSSMISCSSVRSDRFRLTSQGVATKGFCFQKRLCRAGGS